VLELGSDLLKIFSCVLVAAMLAKNHYRHRLRDAAHRWVDRCVLVIALPVIFGSVAHCIRNIADPRAWDYPLFYTVAKAAASGQSFYRPDVLRHVFQEVRLSAAVPDDWVREVNGYWYLPPSALLLAPLGLLGYTASLTVHYLMQLAFFCGSAVLLQRIAPIRDGWRGLLELIILMLVFHPVQDALSLAQLVFGALFFLTLALWALRDNPALAGVALGVGSLYKHILLIIAALMPLARKRGVATACCATLTIAVIVSALVFGIGAFSDFARWGPSYNPAGFYLRGPLNQSLFPVIYRLVGLPRPDLPLSAAILAPPFALVAGAFTLVTAVLCRREQGNPASAPLKMALLISFALLVYPATLYNTIPLILPVFFLLFAYRNSLPVAPWVTIGFVAIEYALASIKYSGAFLVLLSSWFGVALLLMMLSEHGAPAVGVGAEGAA